METVGFMVVFGLATIGIVAVVKKVFGWKVQSERARG